jgi:hypothetical protein
MTFKEFIRPTFTKIFLTIIPLIILGYLIGSQPNICTMDIPPSYCSNNVRFAVIFDLILIIPLYFLNCLLIFLTKKILHKN